VGGLDGRGTHLGILLVVVLLRANPAAHHVVLDGVGQGEVVVPQGGHIAILDQGVVQVAIEVLLHFGDIAHLGDPAHRDLFAPIGVGLGLRHGVLVMYVPSLWRLYIVL